MHIKEICTGAILFILLSGCQPASETNEHPVFGAVRNNDTSILGQYLAEGGDPDIKNDDGDTLLYVASGAKGGTEVAQLLLISGVDPDLTSRLGRTALHTAAAWCNTDIVWSLLRVGARRDIKSDEGKLAIEVICTRPPDRRAEVMDLFLQAREAE